MLRRSFLRAVAAVPVLGWLIPEPAASAVPVAAAAPAMQTLYFAVDPGNQRSASLSYLVYPKDGSPYWVHHDVTDQVARTWIDGVEKHPNQGA